MNEANELVRERVMYILKSVKTMFDKEWHSLSIKKTRSILHPPPSLRRRRRLVNKIRPFSDHHAGGRNLIFESPKE